MAFQLRLYKVFGVTEAYMHLEAFTAFRNVKVILHHYVIKLKDEGNSYLNEDT